MPPFGHCAAAIVVGRRGRGQLSGLLLGSVSQNYGRSVLDVSIGAVQVEEKRFQRARQTSASADQQRETRSGKFRRAWQIEGAKRRRQLLMCKRWKWQWDDLSPPAQLEIVRRIESVGDARIRKVG